MSLEYIARFQKEITFEEAQQVLKKCSIYDDWSLLNQTFDKLSFKLKGIPQRESWNEDVEISISLNAFYAIFHTASKSQREDCIHHLNNCLISFASSCFLEEI